MQTLEKFDRIAPMIGNTPLLEIHFLYKGKKRRIFAKAQGDMIAEATSGNTGIAFSALGSYLGHKVVIYMPDWMSRERITLMQSYGAEVRLVSREEGGFLGSIRMTEELAEKGGVFLPRQFSNEDNVETHYVSTGLELARQLEQIGLKADGVVAGVGTGGTVMGIGKRLKEYNPAFRAFPLEPFNSPTLSTGYKVGKHRIQGISDEFIPSILKLDELSDVVSVDDGDSILMARMLSEKLGVGVGVSSGANFIGSIMAQDKIGTDCIMTTVFADDNKKYLSTDYSDPQEMKEHFVTKNLELTGMIVHK